MRSHASCLMDHGWCIMHHASCVMHHASLIMCHVSCVMHPASCIMHPASWISKEQNTTKQNTAQHNTHPTKHKDYLKQLLDCHHPQNENIMHAASCDRVVLVYSIIIFVKLQSSLTVQYKSVELGVDTKMTLPPDFGPLPWSPILIIHQLMSPGQIGTQTSFQGICTIYA